MTELSVLRDRIKRYALNETTSRASVEWATSMHRKAVDAGKGPNYCAITEDRLNRRKAQHARTVRQLDHAWAEYDRAIAKAAVA